MWNPLSRKKMHVPLNCTHGLQTIRWNIKQTISLFIIAMFLPSGHIMIKSVYALKEHLRKFVSFLPFTICALLWSTCLEGFKLVFKVVLFKRHFSARSNWIFYSTFNYKTTATYVQKNFLLLHFCGKYFLTHLSIMKKSHQRCIWWNGLHRNFQSKFLLWSKFSFFLNTDWIQIFKSWMVSL